MFKSDLYLSNYKSNFGMNINTLQQQSKNAIHSKSSKLQPCLMINPLIAMIGISEYENGIFANLECVINDYKNVEHAFHITRNYSFVYFNKDNQIVHRIKNKNESHSNIDVTSQHKLKLRWNENEIFEYNEKIHNILKNKKYNYDGLIFFISSHGDTDGVIYDSSGNQVPLIAIYDKFNNQHCIQLRNKPKIYFVEACRGNMRTKRWKNSLLIDVDDSNYDPKSPSKQAAFNIDVKTMAQNITQSTTVAACTPEPVAIDEPDDNKDDLKEVDNDTAVDEAPTSHAFGLEKKENSNIKRDLNVIFSKYNYNREIYANTEGYAVVEPGSKGAYMTRAITQAIENNDIIKKDFDSIINHTRKIMLKLMGTSVECAAQVIQDYSSVPRKSFFKYAANFFKS